MFSFFKKKPTAMDALIESIYGAGAKRSVIFVDAILAAKNQLLASKVTHSEASKIAVDLLKGPMPYKTYDLAVSIALAIRKDPNYKHVVEGIDADATYETMLKVKEWQRDGMVVGPLADAYIRVCQPVVSGKSLQTSASSGVDMDNLMSYATKVIERADEMFAETWAFDPNWVGTMSVAEELDQVRGNGEAVAAITEYIFDQYRKGTPVEKCAAFVVLKHFANQRTLEDLMRRSGGGKLWLPSKN